MVLLHALSRGGDNPPTSHAGWLRDAGGVGFDNLAFTLVETNQVGAQSTCDRLPVWCCSRTPGFSP